MKIKKEKNKLSKVYVLVEKDGVINVKKYSDITEEDIIFKDSKRLSKEQKEQLFSSLPAPSEDKFYVVISGVIMERKKYPDSRKKRSIEKYQKSRALKVKDSIRSSEKVLTVGDKIKVIRMQNGLTLKGLSEITGVHYLTIHQLENSVVMTKLETFESICLGLNLSFDAMQNLYSELQLEFFKKRG